MSEDEISELEIVGNVDAVAWTKFWMQTIKKNPGIPYDEGAMIGWFANAIQSGVNHTETKYMLRDAGVSTMSEYVNKVLLGKDQSE